MNCFFNDMHSDVLHFFCIIVCAQVALLLCYCTFKKGIMPPMDSNTEVSDDRFLSLNRCFAFLSSISSGNATDISVSNVGSYVSLFFCLCQEEITSMFRFVKDDTDSLSLDEGLEQFLDQDCK